jgi:5'-phosphate synthase pdxT subunit
VLALQGDFAAHGRMLDRIGCAWIAVRRPDQLAEVSGLILPGGESTTLLKLMGSTQFDRALRGFHGAGKPLFGTCAGLILLASEVTRPSQQCLGLLDATVERNSYGRQLDSFESYGEYLGQGPGGRRPLEMVFIRAPRIIRVGPRIEVLARLGQDPVLVRDGTVLGATFHPELTSDSTVHELFCALCANAR